MGAALNFAQTMIKKLLILTLLLCAGLNGARSESPAPTQVTPELEVIATNGAGREKHLRSVDGYVPLLMVKQNQVVPITLQFPSDKAGMPVAAIPLDGGGVNGEPLVVLPTGKVIFTFKPGAMPGRYRLVVQTPVKQHLLEFYVVDPNNPIRREPARRN
jgi:hypothetical protein